MTEAGEKSKGCPISRTSDRDDYCTPLELWQALDDHFRFNFDAAADHLNVRGCSEFFGMRTGENCNALGYCGDALVENWAGGRRIFCNPPFTKKEKFLKRGVEARSKNEITVFLVPNNARECRWWETYALQADEIINLTPRVNFFLDGERVSGVKFASCLLVYRPRINNINYGVPKEIYWQWNRRAGEEQK